MAEQKLDIIISANNTELKQSLEESTKKLLEVGAAGNDAMNRTANAVDQVADSVKKSTKAITDQQRELKKAEEEAKTREKRLKSITKGIEKLGSIAKKSFSRRIRRTVKSRRCG